MMGYVGVTEGSSESLTAIDGRQGLIQGSSNLEAERHRGRRIQRGKHLDGSARAVERRDPRRQPPAETLAGVQVGRRRKLRVVRPLGVRDDVAQQDAEERLELYVGVVPATCMRSARCTQKAGACGRGGGGGIR